MRTGRFTAARRRFVCAAVVSTAAVAALVAAPAGAAPVTSGCAAKVQPTLAIGNTDSVRVQVKPSPGWHPINSADGVTAGIASADNADALYFRTGTLGTSSSIRTSADLADSSSTALKVTARRSVVGPCGLPTVSVTSEYTGKSNNKRVFAITRYTVAEAKGRRFAVSVSVATFQRAHLPQLERDLLDTYGIIV